MNSAIMGFTISLSLIVTLCWYLERRHKLNRAAISENDYKELVDGMSSGIMLTDKYGKIKYHNKPANKILRSKIQIGSTLTESFSSKWPDLVTSALSVLEFGAGTSRQEFDGRLDCQDVIVGASINRLGNGGIAVFFKDITDVKKLEKSLQKTEQLAAVGELAANIAHEIRNPLGSIRGSAELLSENDELSAEDSQLYNLIICESKRVNEIISDFLKYARVRKPVSQPCSIEPIVTDLMLQLELLAQKKNCDLDIRKNIEYGLPELLVDKDQLKQILLNLGINAIDAIGPCGKVAINVKLTSEAICTISVTDTGPGILKSQFDNLFIPFSSTKSHGTGLGLALVKTLAEAHNGSVIAKNGPQGGACFEVTLPTMKTPMLLSS